MSNFAFLAAEWPELHEPACKAEALAYSDPRAACFDARRALELAVAWLYKHDAALKLPYQDKEALNEFTAGKTLTANQIEFVNLIVDHLTEHGAMKPELLYGSPFTDLNPQGPEGVFNSTQVDELVALLSKVRSRAAA